MGKIKLIKLVYLADKYHLLKYGRTVTNDDYYAMEFGPVGTTVKDVLSFDKDVLATEFKYLKKLVKKSGDDFFASKTTVDYDHLAETDKEALDFVMAKFGKMTGTQLKNYTHRYPEWKQYAHLFEGKCVGRVRLEPEELISVIDDDCFSVSKERLDTVRNMITGMF